MIKLNWKFRVKFALASALFYMLLIWAFDYFSGENNYSIESLLFQGIFFGIFFGIGFPFINERHAAQYANKKAKNIQPKLKENEKVIIGEPANLFRGLESVGGKIFLTDTRIIFKSHKMNIQKGQTNIEYSLINKIVKRNANKNGIRILTNDMQEYDFVINEREMWVEKIRDMVFRHNNQANLMKNQL